MVENPFLNLDVHNTYAKSVERTKAFKQQFDLPIKGDLFSGKVSLAQIIPRFPAVIWLIGTYIKKRWTRIRIPKKYHTRSFSYYSIMPSFDIDGFEEMEFEKLSALENTPSASSSQIIAIKSLLKEVNHTVKETEYIVSRMNEFLPI